MSRDHLRACWIAFRGPVGILVVSVLTGIFVTTVFQLISDSDCHDVQDQLRAGRPVPLSNGSYLSPSHDVDPEEYCQAKYSRETLAKWNTIYHKGLQIAGVMVVVLLAGVSVIALCYFAHDRYQVAYARVLREKESRRGRP